LDVYALSGVVDYQPGELILTARPGTPMQAIHALLEQQGQMLGFEPDMGQGGTIGGAIMVADAGSRRPFAGSARDHFLGFHAVSGRGEAFKAGGKVVKNVTGYDLPKLFAGSFGTLGVLTELTVKVMPRPEQVETLALPSADPTHDFASLRRMMQGDYDISGLARLPAALSSTGAPILLVRFEGTPKSIAARKANLFAREKWAEADQVNNDVWAKIGSGGLFADAPVLWRISIAPDRAAEISNHLTPGDFYADWAGGRLFWTGDGTDDHGAARLRRVIGGQGHCFLLRAPDDVRAQVPVFEPLAPGLKALSARVKHQFDPKNILNPGRMGDAF
jgi:glycolate oxidase FAD binding subunit